MTEERNALLTVETVIDLPVWKEYCSFYPLTRTKNRRISLIGTLLILWGGFTMVLNPSMGLSVLTGFGIASVPSLIRYFRNRNNKWGYQEVLNQAGGKAPHALYRFCEDGIECCQKHKDSVSFFPYWKFSEIFDCGNLLLLFCDAKTLLLLDLRWIQGGTREELESILQSKCTMVKKGIRKVTFWKALRKIQRWLFMLVLAGAVIFSAMEIASAWNAKVLKEDLTYPEAAAILEELDIHCSDDMIAEAEKWEAEYRQILAEITGDLGYTPMGYTGRDRVISLLCDAGYGNYDPDTWEWTPPDTGVLWLDMEAFNISTMYTQYLQGLAAISGGDLVITDIEENHDNVNPETGKGNVSLSFTLNGTRHQFSIPLEYDWYNARSLDEINAVLSTGEKRVYALSDDGQGILLFYRSRQWASQFKKTTGIPLMEKISTIWYGYPF